MRFLKEQARIQRPQFHTPCSCMMASLVKFSYLPTLLFCSFLDNVKIIVNKICFLKEKQGSPNVLKIIKSKQSYSNGHPIIVHFSIICMRSRDEQKQLARTSLRWQRLSSCFQSPETLLFTPLTNYIVKLQQVLSLIFFYHIMDIFHVEIPLNR